MINDILYFCLIIYMLLILAQICKKYTNYDNIEDFTSVTSSPSQQGQLLISDQAGNLSAFSLGSGNTLISDSSGNILTTTTGQFGSNNINTTGSITGGSVTATGPITGGSVATTGSITTTGVVTTGSLSTTGAINTGSVSETGAINAVNISATNDVNSTNMKASNALYTNNWCNGGNSSCLNYNSVVNPLTVDNRTVNDAPDTYKSKGLGRFNEFKQCGTIGITQWPGYCYLETIVGYGGPGDNSGGPVIQIARQNDATLTRTGTGTTVTGWSLWNYFANNGNGNAKYNSLNVTGNITGNQFCIGENCITSTDIQNLKNIITNNSKISLKNTTMNSGDGGWKRYLDPSAGYGNNYLGYGNTPSATWRIFNNSTLQNWDG